MDTTTIESRWAVQNRETGKVAWTRESNYHNRAYFQTREQARRALREGRVYRDPSQGRVVRVTS